MKKIIIAAAISMMALVGCTSQESPGPDITIFDPPITNESSDDGAITNSQKFVEFVKENGGLYGQVANESDIISLGDTICQGLAGGLSENEITQVLAQALVNNNMGNDDGAKFGAALIVGAKNYLCGLTF